MNFFRTQVILIFLFGISFSQNFSIVGDSLIGKIVGEEKFREIIGNVKIVSENTIITCEKAVQNLTNQDLSLSGNIILTNDTLKAFAENAMYNKGKDFAFTEDKVKIIQNEDRISANSGNFDFLKRIAEFKGNVFVENPQLKLNSDFLRYFDFEKKVQNYGNVVVQDSVNILYCDSLFTDRIKSINEAFGKVKIYIKNEKTTLYGGFFRDSAAVFSEVEIQPLLIQENNENEKIDSLFLLADKIVIEQDSVNQKMFSQRNVKLHNKQFQLIADSIYFDITNDKIQAFKPKNELLPVVIWSGENQISGDSVSIYLKEDKIDRIEIIKNAMMIETKDPVKHRFNQISGNKIELYFADEKISKTKIYDNVLAIYYTIEEDEITGLMKASSKNAEIVFEEKTVKKVKLFGSPESEFHPIELVETKENEFILPYFQLFNNKPTIQEFLIRITQ